MLDRLKVDGLIRDEIIRLAANGPIGKATFEQLRMNSYERNYLLEFITNEAFAAHCELCNKNVSPPDRYPTTYNEIVLAKLFPMLLDRFIKLMDSDVSAAGLPRVLHPRNKAHSSISVERALKNILDVLKQSNVDENDLNGLDAWHSAIDDTKTMLDNVQ